MCPDYDNRPSWRELDKRKDKSSHRQDEKPEFPGQGKKQETYSMKVYKRKLDEMFSGKTKKKKSKSSFDPILKAQGTKEFHGLVAEYVNDKGIPDDWEALMAFLDHKDSQVVIQCLQKMGPQVDDQSPARRQMFQSKLKILDMTTRDQEVRAAIESLKNT